MRIFAYLFIPDVKVSYQSRAVISYRPGDENHLTNSGGQISMRNDTTLKNVLVAGKIGENILTCIELATVTSTSTVNVLIFAMDRYREKWYLRN